MQVSSLTRNEFKGAFQFDNRYTYNTLANLDNAIKQVESYVMKALNLTKEFSITAKNTENINCYLYPGNVTFGGSTTPLMMPMPAYLMAETPKSHPVWWTQQLEILASRQNFETFESFLTEFPKMELKQKATFTTMLLGQYVQTLEYVSDKTSNRPIEMFGDALAMKCGDCEDLALAIKQMEAAFGQTNHILPILKEMQDISRQYVYLFCLEGVTATHTQNDKVCFLNFDKGGGLLRVKGYYINKLKSN